MGFGSGPYCISEGRAIWEILHFDVWITLLHTALLLEIPALLHFLLLASSFHQHLSCSRLWLLFSIQNAFWKNTIIKADLLDSHITQWAWPRWTQHSNKKTPWKHVTLMSYQLYRLLKCFVDLTKTEPVCRKTGWLWLTVENALMFCGSAVSKGL